MHRRSPQRRPSASARTGRIITIATVRVSTAVARSRPATALSATVGGSRQSKAAMASTASASTRVSAMTNCSMFTW